MADQPTTTRPRAGRARRSETIANLAKTPATVPWPDGLTDPDAYGLILEGNCLAPRVCHGETAILSPAKKVEVGDIVALWPADGSQPVLKRVVTLPIIPIGTRYAPGSTVDPAIIVEQLNPPGDFCIRTSALKAMHAMVAVHRSALAGAA